MDADWNWEKAELNRHNAEFLGTAAHLAYSKPSDVRDALKTWNMDLVQFFDCEETQGYLARNDETCILAFRGTQPDKLRDWLYDLDGIQIKGPVGQVHRGFSSALDKVWTDVSNALNSQREKRSLWVTGHSLGGALAALAAARLVFSNKAQPVSGLYTYGQPRVGDAEFCEQFDKAFGANTFRFVNFKDIVPRVPLRKMSYGDIGMFQYFNEQKWDPATKWADILLHSVGNTIQEIAQHDVQDHMMDKYLAKLKKLANPDPLHGH